VPVGENLLGGPFSLPAMQQIPLLRQTDEQENFPEILGNIS
jgi:hypothetical protein